MKMVNGPCKDCTRRYVGCHAECEDFAIAKAKHEKAKTERKKEMDYIGYVSDNARRMKKGKNKWKK